MAAAPLVVVVASGVTRWNSGVVVTTAREESLHPNTISNKEDPATPRLHVDKKPTNFVETAQFTEHFSLYRIICVECNFVPLPN